MRTSLLRIGILLWSSAIVTSSASAQQILDSAVEAKIQNIENNMAPLVVIKGQSGSHVTLASRMAALHVPGVSIAFIHDGKIEWARGFGVTKIGGAPVTANTLFQAASISKPVTAMAALHLVQSGQLNLDADINQYLKTWKLPENSFTAQKKVTLRELLTHTAGMTVHGFPGYASGETVPTLVQVLNGEKPANNPVIRVDTVPGTIWSYSGGGYTITQQLLLDVTGKSFPSLLQDTVLGSIGMTHSTYEQPLPVARQADAATPYDRNGAPIVGGFHTYPEMAAAGLWTTPSDLARYAIEIQKALAGQSNQVLSKTTASEMVKSGGLGNWGLGLHVGGSAANPYFDHNGANAGFMSNLVAYAKGDGVAIMTNGENGGRLADEILRTIAFEYKWPDFAPIENTVAKIDLKLLDTYAGYYQQGRFTVVNIARSGDHLAAKQGAQDLGDLYPTNDREWFFANNPEQLSFTVGRNGDAMAFARHVNDIEIPSARISALQASQIADELAAKVKNQTQDPNSEAALRRNIDELRAGKPNYELMSPIMANVTKQQLPQLQAMIVDAGALKSVAFKGAGPAGADIYNVTFEKGAMQWRIVLGVDGKSEMIGVQMLP